jgi:hypothetical protein
MGREFHSILPQIILLPGSIPFSKFALFLVKQRPTQPADHTVNNIPRTTPTSPKTTSPLKEQGKTRIKYNTFNLPIKLLKNLPGNKSKKLCFLGNFIFKIAKNDYDCTPKYGMLKK